MRKIFKGGFDQRTLMPEDFAMQQQLARISAENPMALYQVPKPNPEVEAFLTNNPIEAHAASRLRALPPDQQQLVIQSSLVGARDPTAVVIGRIRNVAKTGVRTSGVAGMFQHFAQRADLAVPGMAPLPAATHNPPPTPPQPPQPPPPQQPEVSNGCADSGYGEPRQQWSEYNSSSTQSYAKSWSLQPMPSAASRWSQSESRDNDGEKDMANWSKSQDDWKEQSATGEHANGGVNATNGAGVPWSRPFSSRPVQRESSPNRELPPSILFSPETLVQSVPHDRKIHAFQHVADSREPATVPLSPHNGRTEDQVPNSLSEWSSSPASRGLDEPGLSSFPLEPTGLQLSPDTSTAVSQAIQDHIDRQQAQMGSNSTGCFPGVPNFGASDTGISVSQEIQEHMEMQRAQYLMNNTACPPGVPTVGASDTGIAVSQEIQEQMDVHQAQYLMNNAACPPGLNANAAALIQQQLEMQQAAHLAQYQEFWVRQQLQSQMALFEAQRTLAGDERAHGSKRPGNFAPKASSQQMLPGDWNCPSCGDHQFARNRTCRHCGAMKPPNAY